MLSKHWDMSNNKNVRLGDIVERFRKKCGNANATVSGVDINKQFIPTRANLEETDISSYYLVPPTYFACNLMHIGRDERLPIAYNSTCNNIVVTSAYFVFHVKESKKHLIVDDFLYIFFNSKEIDRLTWFYTDSSVRGNLNESRFLDIEIPLLSIDEQQKVVNCWKALREIKEQNEQKAQPLMQVCQSYIQDLKHKYEAIGLGSLNKKSLKLRIGDAIMIADVTNTDARDYEVLGLNKDKVFMPTAANMESIDTKKYKVVSKGMFAFSGMQTGRDVCIRIALYDSDTPCLISPAYTTFTLDKSKGILPEFYMLMFKRKEMDRLGWFISESSVRSNLEWPRFLDIEIPLPPIEVQQAIVNIYNCANEAKQIAAEADRMSREVCPALLQHIINN